MNSLSRLSPSSSSLLSPSSSSTNKKKGRREKGVKEEKKKGWLIGGLGKGGGKGEAGGGDRDSFEHSNEHFYHDHEVSFCFFLCSIFIYLMYLLVQLNRNMMKIPILLKQKWLFLSHLSQIKFM